MKENEIQSLIDNFIEQRDNYDLDTQYAKSKTYIQNGKNGFYRWA